ncbi:MAG: radical SAM protein, partial [Nitrospira sp.]
KAYFPRELTLSEIRRLFMEMKDVGIVWLNLTGGDIFMRPDFFELYEAASDHGFLLQLYTNGTLFTPAIVERLRARPPFSIDISCHSADEVQFDWFTQVPGSYRAFRRGLDLLEGSGVPFTLKTKLMNWNAGELNRLKTFTQAYGQSFGYTTSLSPRLNGDCSSLEYRIAPEMLRTLASQSAAPREENHCGAAEALPAPADDRLFRCGCGTDTIHINAWGELSTCTFQYETRVSLRNASLRDAIETVFEHTRRLTYRSDSPCQTCTVYQLCDKQPTQARWEAGHPEQPIPYDCDIAMVRAQATQRHDVPHPLDRSFTSATSGRGATS